MSSQRTLERYDFAASTAPSSKFGNIANDLEPYFSKKNLGDKIVGKNHPSSADCKLSNLPSYEGSLSL